MKHLQRFFEILILFPLLLSLMVLVLPVGAFIFLLKVSLEYAKSTNT